MTDDGWYRVETQRQTRDEQGRCSREKAELVLATGDADAAADRWLDLIDELPPDVEVRLVSPAAPSLRTEGAPNGQTP